MKTLFLMRHAKSDWDANYKNDHDRPIGGRGTRNAKELAKFLQKRKITADIAYVSDSKRTLQTLNIIQKKQSIAKEINISLEFYLIEKEELLDRIKKTSDEKKSILILGHNPGLEDLANFLLDGNIRILAKFPTSSFLSIQLDVERWIDINSVSSKILQFWIPANEVKANAK